MTETPISTHSLRRASVDDLAHLADLDRRFIPQPWTQDQWAAELSKPYSHVLVITDDATDTEIAGYIVFWVLGDEVQVQNVAVDLPFRGLGFGARLVREAVRAGLKSEAKRVVLEVRRSNAPAIALYQSLGMSIVTVRRSFYSNGEDAYQMALSLQNTPVDQVPF